EEVAHSYLFDLRRRSELELRDVRDNALVEVELAALDALENQRRRERLRDRAHQEAGVIRHRIAGRDVACAAGHDRLLAVVVHAGEDARAEPGAAELRGLALEVNPDVFEPGRDRAHVSSSSIVCRLSYHKRTGHLTVSSMTSFCCLSRHRVKGTPRNPGRGRR